MRTVLFQQTGITDLTTEILLGCNDTDFKKKLDLAISSALGNLNYRRDSLFDKESTNEIVGVWKTYAEIKGNQTI